MQGTILDFGKKEVNNVVSVLRTLHPKSRQGPAKS